jgi:hypothetical protein
MFIATAEAAIVYDALKTTFDVQEVGGSLSQRKNTITGEFVVDRTICPLALVPSLLVTDPNDGDATTDETSMLVVNWYLVTTVSGVETETEIISTDSSQSYYKSGINMIVQANVEPGNVVVLRIKASFVNPNNNETLRFTRDFDLGSTSYVEFNPAMELDIANLVTVSPFELTASNRYRVVTAKFFAGTIDISTNSNMVYIWEKLDGTAYRAINDTDVDVYDVTGRTLTIDLYCVKRSKFRCTAYYNADPYNRTEFRMKRLFTLDRQLLGYSLTPRVTIGKFLRKDAEFAEAEAVLTVNSNQVDNPTKYFILAWTFYLQSGTAKQNITLLGYGDASVRVLRSLIGYDRTKTPTFQLEYEPLTEYRLLTDASGNTIVDANGNRIVAQTTD